MFLIRETHAHAHTNTFAQLSSFMELSSAMISERCDCVKTEKNRLLYSAAHDSFLRFFH